MVTFVRYLVWLFWVLVLVLSFLAAQDYSGRHLVFVIFTISANLLLWSGFRNNAIFFDAFIGVFFWLGFWLKLSIRIVFFDGQFHEPTGNFDGSGVAFDRALLATTCGFLGLLAASYLREIYFFSNLKAIRHAKHIGLHRFYITHRKLILAAFVALVVTVAATNIFFGIYQRGMIPRTSLPYGLGGIYSWLLLFGLASISAVVMHIELGYRKETTYTVPIFGMFESFLTNVSLLSRGMILNTSALAYGVFKHVRSTSIKTNIRFWALSLLIFILFFGCSIALVNVIRMGESIELHSLSKNVGRTGGMTKPLVLDRWVGIEGVMAVSSHPKLGWDLWNQAWEEKLLHGKLSFYDTTMIVSRYSDLDTSKSHYISLPGILAFCFYPGSFLFLFVIMLLLGGLAAVVEKCVFILGGGNLILCSLLAQVIAYRYAHFGYVPAQSYLLFGAIFLNLLIINLSNKFLLSRNGRPAVNA